MLCQRKKNNPTPAEKSAATTKLQNLTHQFQALLPKDDSAITPASFQSYIDSRKVLLKKDKRTIHLAQLFSWGSIVLIGVGIGLTLSLSNYDTYVHTRLLATLLTVAAALSTARWVLKFGFFFLKINNYKY